MQRALPGRYYGSLFPCSLRNHCRNEAAQASTYDYIVEPHNCRVISLAAVPLSES